MLKYLAGVPLLIIVPTSFMGYKRRTEYLNDPVLKRALFHIQNDQRVLDFCGDEVEPGWIIQKKQTPNENWVKFDLTVKGYSGKLKTTVIGDFLQHQELSVLEKERQHYFEELGVLELEEQKAAQNDIQKLSIQEQRKKIKEQYAPVDFDSYSIVDKATLENIEKIHMENELKDNEKIWRISSLTTYVDDDTKILILPLPESKRSVRIQDTNYSYKRYQDLFDRYFSINKSLEVPTEKVRFEDKTTEEISEDIKKKRRQQFSKLNKIRYYQFFGMTAIGFCYLFVYRPYFIKKSVMNSTIYHQAVNFIKSNPKIQDTLGKHMQIMNCNGKISPMKSDVDFELIVFGSNQKGKIRFKSLFEKENQSWVIKNVDVYTRNDEIHIV